jgi:DNA-binding GntR family transcriptional regulator
MSTRLPHRTLASAIVEQLRNDILAGAYAAGTQLRQDALAEVFGVSRIPVREALFQLEAEGLVHIEPHKGAVVAAFSLDEIDDVFDLRAMLEPRLLRDSVPRLTPGDFEALTALDIAFGRAVATQEIGQWGELNARLHLGLYQHAQRPKTLAVVTSLLQTSDRYTRLQMNRTPAMVRAGREHRQLLTLCRTGKVEKACEHLVEHIEAVRRDLHLLLRHQQAAAAKAGNAAPAARPTVTPRGTTR